MGLVSFAIIQILLHLPFCHKLTYSMAYEYGGLKPQSRKLSTDPFFYQLDSVHTLDYYFFKIHPNIIFSFTLGLPNGLLLIGFPVKTLKAFILSTF